MIQEYQWSMHICFIWLEFKAFVHKCIIYAGYESDHDQGVGFLLHLMKTQKSDQNLTCHAWNSVAWMQKGVQICRLCEIWIKFNGLVHIVHVSMMLVFCYQ